MSTYRKRLDRLASDGVCWMPYGDHCAVRDFVLISLFFGHIQWGPSIVIHRPERVVRKFGYVYSIPPHSPASRLCLEDIDDRWMHFSKYLALVGQICVVLGQYATDYINWFYMMYHPFIRPAQPRDPARHPPVFQDDTYVELDIPQYLMVTTTMEEAPADAPSHVEQSRHAVVTYIFSLL